MDISYITVTSYHIQKWHREVFYNMRFKAYMIESKNAIIHGVIEHFWYKVHQINMLPLVVQEWNFNEKTTYFLDKVS